MRHGNPIEGVMRSVVWTAGAIVVGSGLVRAVWWTGVLAWRAACGHF